MVRASFYATVCIAVLSTARPAAADELPPPAPVAAMPAPAVAAPADPDAARLLALEIAARAKGGGNNGRFTPTVPVPRTITPTAAPVSAPPPTPVGNLAATCAPGAAPPPNPADGGMRFMPLRRGNTGREFPLPARGEVTPTAEALKAMVGSNKNESELARAALQSASAPSPAAMAAAEMANAQNAASLAPSTDPSGHANQAVLREIQRYRNTHGF
jgi:hypothetical protein